MPDLPTKLRSWYQGLLDFVYPPLCLGCGGFVEDYQPICQACTDAIQRFDNPICLNCWQPVTQGAECLQCGPESFVLFAYGDYSEPLTEIVIHYKFKGILAPAEIIATRLYEQFADRLDLAEADCLMPIPLHPAREQARGYNQATVLADRLARHLDLPVVDNLLYRFRRRRPQARLTGAARARNIVGVFAVDDIPIEHYRAILVDDVVTSGATVFEARRVLREVGISVPAVISMAHGV